MTTFEKLLENYWFVKEQNEEQYKTRFNRRNTKIYKR